jgi:hypothetical protein
MSTPMRRIRSPCCAPATTGHAAQPRNEFPPSHLSSPRLIGAEPIAGPVAREWGRQPPDDHHYHHRREADVVIGAGAAALLGPNWRGCWSLPTAEASVRPVAGPNTWAALMRLKSIGLKMESTHAEQWQVRSKELRAQAKQMISPETKSLMLGVADDYERLTQIAEAMALIRSVLESAIPKIRP